VLLKALFPLLMLAFFGWNLIRAVRTSRISGWRYRIAYQQSAQPLRYWVLFGVYVLFAGLSLWMLWATIQSNRH
jgi:hypothetical protein